MRICFFFLFILTSIYAKEEIVVPLHSSSSLCKTFLATERLNDALKQILIYDIEQNGFCLLTTQKKEASLIITAQVQDQKIILQAEHDKRSFRSPPLSLTGKLEEDRCSLHKLHDALCKELFGQKGIASNHILYTARKKEGKDSSKWISEVWLSDYDGANAKQLTKENALIVTPTFLPGKAPYFLYVSYKEGEPKIFLGGEGKSKRVTYMLGNQFMPTISKQLNRIAFISTIHGKEDLFFQDFSLEKGVVGKAKKLFSAPMATQGTPSFSPDGNQIAFVSNKDGTARIYVMALPKTGQRPDQCPLTLISKKNRDNTSPNWSPDGAKIAYSSLTRGVRQIWIYDMKKKEEIQLTFKEAHCENPVWAPDSLHLLYNSASHENGELYMIDCNQKRPTKITTGPKDKRFPAWEG